MSGRATTSMGDNRTFSHTAAAEEQDDRKLLRKLDLHLIPTMTLLYLLSFLDRVNIGQAKLNGLMGSLNLSSDQYNTCFSVLFLTYLALKIPSNWILKKIRPSRWSPFIMVLWGTVMTYIGLVRSCEGLLICRMLLGATESGFFPVGVKDESWWYTDTRLWYRKNASTRWTRRLAMDLLYMEGIVTVFVGQLAFIRLYDFPNNRPRFLTEQECISSNGKSMFGH